jgi:predicted amidohydrolase YtcJ
MKYYGAERLNNMFALRSFLDAGIPATQASDYPPGEFIPMMALQSEVTRTDIKGNVWGQNKKLRWSRRFALERPMARMPRMKRI